MSLPVCRISSPLSIAQPIVACLRAVARPRPRHARSDGSHVVPRLPVGLAGKHQQARVRDDLAGPRVGGHKEGFFRDRMAIDVTCRELGQVAGSHRGAATGDVEERLRRPRRGLRRRDPGARPGCAARSRPAGRPAARPGRPAASSTAFARSYSLKPAVEQERRSLRDGRRWPGSGAPSCRHSAPDPRSPTSSAPPIPGSGHRAGRRPFPLRRDSRAGTCRSGRRSATATGRPSISARSRDATRVGRVGPAKLVDRRRVLGAGLVDDAGDRPEIVIVVAGATDRVRHRELAVSRCASSPRGWRSSAGLS